MTATSFVLTGLLLLSSQTKSIPDPPPGFVRENNPYDETLRRIEERDAKLTPEEREAARESLRREQERLDRERLNQQIGALAVLIIGGAVATLGVVIVWRRYSGPVVMKWCGRVGLTAAVLVLAQLLATGFFDVDRDQSFLFAVAATAVIVFLYARIAKRFHL